jgi:hypothetical protein
MTSPTPQKKGMTKSSTLYAKRQVIDLPLIFLCQQRGLFIKIETMFYVLDLSKESRENVIKDTNAVPNTSSTTEQEVSHIWSKAKEAQAAGDEILAKILLKAYTDLTAPSTESSVAAVKPPIIRSVSAYPVLATSAQATNISTEKEKEDDLIYAVGVVPNHQDIGFTPFFDENIKKLRAPLPLTIFDREWQKEALSAHLSSKPAKSSEDKAYRGLPFHPEWTQTHSKWTNNHRIFHLTLRDVYHKTIFADKLLTHKMHCDNIADEFGFMTAFRYDMQVRANAFAHRVQSKDGAAIPDISVRQNLVAERCYNDARSAGETRWTDNYYAPGGSHEGIDPDTGRERLLIRSASQNGHRGRGGQLRVASGQHHGHNQAQWANYQHSNHNNRADGYNNIHQSYFNNHHQYDYNRHDNHQYTNSFNSNLPAGPSESKKGMRGYQGSNYTEGFVDRRTAGGKGGDVKNGGGTGKA